MLSTKSARYHPARKPFIFYELKTFTVAISQATNQALRFSQSGSDTTLRHANWLIFHNSSLHRSRFRKLAYAQLQDLLLFFNYFAKQREFSASAQLGQIGSHFWLALTHVFVAFLKLCKRSFLEQGKPSKKSWDFWSFLCATWNKTQWLSSTRALHMVYQLKWEVR